MSRWQPFLRNASRPLLLLTLLGTAPLAVEPSLAQSASTWNKRGENAELHEDYDAAFEDYHQAHLKKPADLRYRERYERLRFQAAVTHVDRGRVLKQSGDPAGALREFTRAHEIDPGNQTAEQEIKLLDSGTAPAPATNAPSGPPGGAATTAPGDTEASPTAAAIPEDPFSALSQIGQVAGPVTLQPVSNDPITLHTVADTRDIYQAVGKLAGLNVLFDPNYTSKRIAVDLTAVSLPDALRIIGALAGTFFKPVTPNTIFVAQNNRTNRTDLDELAVQTFYLTNASQQNDANEILTAIRNLLDPSVKIYLVPSQNAIVMRATPDQLLLAQKLLQDLDRPRPEVVVDVAILSVNRDKVRQLGITFPQSIGLTPSSSTSSSTTTSSSTGNSTSTGTTTGSTSTGTGTSSNLTLNNLANLNANNVAVTITGGTVNALLTDNDTRILQNPRIRATDGQRATLKIGSRIPVATGSYNAGVSTGIASIGVQTQFTYLDIGVNIDMTPTVHYDHEVTMKMRIEVSSHNGDQNISGVVEPIIAQDISEQTIQLKEGEPSILAGIVQRQDIKGVNGTPGLGEIPFLKYFFSSQNKEVQQGEIVFLLIPHIVRESVLTRLNTRPIDTGTGQGIELRRDPNLLINAPIAPVRRPTSNTSAANAAEAMIGQLAQQAQMPTPQNPTPGFNPGTGQPTTAPQPTTPQATQPATQPATQTPRAATPAPATGSGTPVTLSVVPPVSTVAAGGTFQVSVSAANAADLYSLPIQLSFNPKLIQLVNVDSGDLLAKDGQPVATVHRDEGDGVVNISTSRPPGVKGVDGQGSIAVLTFKALAPGDATVNLSRVGARNSSQASLPAVGAPGTVHIR